MTDGPWLDPTDLLLFARVAECGSFTLAATQLGWPKSTLSRRLSALEERLGERLMRRTTRRLTLTDFGAAAPTCRVSSAGWVAFEVGEVRNGKVKLDEIVAPIGISAGFACMAVAIQTMHNALVGAGRLKKGETVLIQGASSGVGLMALQIAKYKGARLVIGSSTDKGRRDRLHEFGADLSIDTSGSGWVDQVLAATGGVAVWFFTRASRPLMRGLD
mgnify:CR=1 FL=1